MPTNDGFDTNHALPQFLSGHAEETAYAEEYELEYELQGTPEILKASIFKTGLFAVAMTVSGIAIALALGHPVKVLADATASLIDNSGPQRGANQSASTIRSAADIRPIQAPDAQLYAPAPWGEFAALSESANQAQTGNNEPSSGALLMQFEAWAAKQDARAEEPVQPVEEAAPTRIADYNPAPVEPMQKPRKAKSFQNARAEVPHVQKPKARVQREQAASRLAPPAQDARTLEQQPMQTAQPSSFLQNSWWR